MNCVQLKGYIYFSFIFNTSQTRQLNKEVAAFRAENNLKSQKKQKVIAPRERALRLFTFASSCTVFFDREIG
jgi:hypothetical protein